MTRIPIPNKIEATLMFQNDHTCCVCREKGKDVQIHHVDDNNSNNNIQNLCVVCLDCHSKVTGRRGLGKSYTHLEVLKYKKIGNILLKRKDISLEVMQENGQ